MVSLRPVPADAPRPQPLSTEVIARALLPVEDALGSWFQDNLPKVDADQRKFCLTLALRQGEMDAFQAAIVLASSFKIPGDEALVRLLMQVTSGAGFALRVLTREWVVKTGYRFPANKDDAIEWVDPDTRLKRGGKVIEIDRAMAVALVQPNLGPANTPIRILAESVVGNLTQKQYTEIKPVLGQRYDDAPALGAAFEAERQKLRAEVQPIDVKPAYQPCILKKMPNGSMIKLDPCPRCEGLVGQIYNAAFCDICDGHGYLPDPADA